MRCKFILCILPLLFCFAVAQADDVGIIIPAEDFNQNTAQPALIYVYWNNAALLRDASIGLRVSATGTATVWLDNTIDYTDIYIARGGTAPGALGWNFRYAPDTSAMPDTVLVSGNYMVVLLGLFPDNSSEPLYPLGLFFSGATGPDYAEQICIDSCALVAPGGDWLFDSGSGNTNPTFNNNQGPVCLNYVQTYITGDSNGDNIVNVSDAVHIINYIFAGGDPPNPLESGDANCDGLVNVSDAVYIINYIFTGGPEPGDPDGDGEPDC